MWSPSFQASDTDIEEEEEEEEVEEEEEEEEEFDSPAAERAEAWRRSPAPPPSTTHCWVLGSQAGTTRTPLEAHAARQASRVGASMLWPFLGMGPRLPRNQQV